MGHKSLEEKQVVHDVVLLFRRLGKRNTFLSYLLAATG